MSNEHEERQNNIKIGRRTLVRWFLGIGTLSSLAALGSVLATVKSGSKEQDLSIKKGDTLVFALGTNKGEPIKRTSIVPGQAALVFPAGKEAQDNLIMVLHLNPEDIVEPTKIEWVSEGFVAYSAICTHLGCTVNFSHEGMEGAKYSHIHCPCHAAMFNPQAGGRVIGGPAPRPLPQLPLVINPNGELVTAGPFEEPVGVL